MNAPGSMFEKGPDIDGPDSVKGGLADKVGNFVIQVQPSNSSEALFNLWFLDSGDYSKIREIGGYDWVYLDQIRWYSETSKALEVQAGKSVPGITFMHIPPIEYREASAGEIVGDMFEGIFAPDVNSGLLTEMRTRGDVKIMTVGHDHVNDFCGVWQGIDLCYGGGIGNASLLFCNSPATCPTADLCVERYRQSRDTQPFPFSCFAYSVFLIHLFSHLLGIGYTTYGRPDWPRRARLFELFETGEVISYKRLDDLAYSKIDEQQLV